MSKLVEIKNLTVTYGDYTALNNADLEVHPNDFIGIIGPNGGGKTTLLKAILGLKAPSSGQIIFSDKLENGRSDIGYLPQVNKFDNRFPISVFDVVLSGITTRKQWHKLLTSFNNKQVNSVLQELAIEHLAKKTIGELSGGQMQKVFLARALVSKPKVLVLDEPNTYVDYRFESELYEKLKELNKRMAILLVSHDVGTICSHVKSIACVNRKLNYHPSNIISPELLESYECPIQMITHGDVPHTVLGAHNHKH